MHEFLSRVRFRWDHRWAPDRMSEYLDGELGEAGRGRMERHVRECPECRGLLGGLGLIVKALHALSPPDDGLGAVQIAASVRGRLSDTPRS